LDWLRHAPILLPRIPVAKWELSHKPLRIFGRILIGRNEALNSELGIREVAAVFGNLEGSLSDYPVEIVEVALKQRMSR
jgi:hypothetical protein